MLLITVVWRSPPVLHSWPGLQGDFLATSIELVHLLAARGIGHCMALMIGALHRARLCRHAESHTAEGRQHEASNH